MLIYTRVPKHKPRKKRKADVSVAENYANIRLTNRTVKFDRTELSKIKTFVPPPAYRRKQVMVQNLVPRGKRLHCVVAIVERPQIEISMQ